VAGTAGLRTRFMIAMLTRRTIHVQAGHELDRRGAELLSQVLTEREEKNSIAIASNQSFSG